MVELADNISLLAEKFKPIVFLHSNEEVAPISLDDYFANSTVSVLEDIKHRWHPFKKERYIIKENVLEYPADMHMNGADTFLNYIEEIKSPRNVKLDNVPIYVKTESRRIEHDEDYVDYVLDIIYIFVFPFNSQYKFYGLYLTGSHQGDIEHIRVRLINNKLDSVFYSAHGKREGKWYSYGKKHFREYRPVVFLARGSHAAYPFAGTAVRIMGFANDKMDMGYLWDGPLKIIDESKYLLYKGDLGPQGIKSIGARDWKI